MFELWSINDDLISTYTRSEKGYGLRRPGLKRGVENKIFQSEIGSGFGEPGGTHPPKLLKLAPWDFVMFANMIHVQRQSSSWQQGSEQPDRKV